MFPLFLPQSRNTRDLELRVEYLEKMLAQKTDAPDDIFPAQITSGPTDDAYAWKRWSWDENGDRTDHPNGQTGSVDVDPAYDPNNATHSAGTEVWLRKRMATTTSKRIKYEIIAGGGGGDDVEIGEPTSIGSPPPAGYEFWRIVRWDVDLNIWQAYETVLLKNANTP